MKKYKLDFANVYATSEQSIPAFEQANKHNRQFWNRARPRYTIFHCETEAEFRRYSQPHYFKIARAVVLSNGDIVVRSQSSARLSARKYLEVLTHEINHSYWLHFTSDTVSWTPFWLFEATACLVAQNSYLFSKQQLAEYMLVEEERFPLPYRYLTRYLSSIDQVKYLYSLWYHFLQFLIDERSEVLPPFLFAFFKQPSPQTFHALCEDYFGETLLELKSIFLEEYFTDL